MGKAGRPPLEPRLAKLEQQVADLQALIARIDVPRETIPQRLESYKPAFDRWPSKSSA